MSRGSCVSLLGVSKGWKDPLPQQHLLARWLNWEMQSLERAPAVSQHLACCSQASPGAKLCHSTVLGAPGWSFCLGQLKYPWNLDAAAGVGSVFVVRDAVTGTCFSWCRNDQTFPLLLLCQALPNGCFYSPFQVPLLRGGRAASGHHHDGRSRTWPGKTLLLR